MYFNYVENSYKLILNTYETLKNVNYNTFFFKLKFSLKHYCERKYKFKFIRLDYKLQNTLKNTFYKFSII